MCYMEECVSFRSLRIGYELQGARSQIKRAYAPRTRLSEPSSISGMQSGICSLCRANLRAVVTTTALRRLMTPP